MNKFILMAITLVLFACDKNEVLNPENNEWLPEPTKQVVVMKQTATWCGSCPNAAGIVEELITEFGNQIVPLAVHSSTSDPMFPNCGSSFRSDRSSSYFPSFFITEDRLSASLSNTRNAILDKLSEPVVAAVAIKSSFEGDSILVETKTAFYETLDGSYYLSIYVTEDSIDGGNNSGAYNQSGAGEFFHQHVLRTTSVPNSFWGEELVQNPSNSDLIERNFKIGLDPSWVQSKLKISAVLWKKDVNAANTYTFVNAI